MSDHGRGPLYVGPMFPAKARTRGRSTLVLWASLPVVVIALAVSMVTDARAAQSGGEPVKKVTLCHKEGGPQYVRINIAVEAAINGHAKNHPLDIIPPFTYKDGKETKDFPGQNWGSTGMATWENGCVAAPAAEPIEVFVACVAVSADGTFSAQFGYESSNTVERTVPVGPDNLVSPGEPNRGQPTAFAPGRVQEAFTVSGVTGSLTWSVTFDGRTSSAAATASSPACAQPPPSGDPKISPFVKCVTNNSDGTYDATFGYESSGTLPVTIAAGADNGFAPAPDDRGQTTVFLPSRVERAFTVTRLPGTTRLVWTLRSDRPRTATAGSDSPTKRDRPPPPAQAIGIFVACVQNHPDGSYDATFGYDNPNAQTVEIAVSEDNNSFSPRPRNRGQVTTFEPGNVREAFTVRDLPEAAVLVWTLAYQGTRTATASAAHPEKCGGPPPAFTQIGVFVQCVQNNPDGSYDATFGYESREHENVTIPVGGRNAFSPAPEDREQPVVFGPGNVSAAFIVRSIPGGVHLTWRLHPENGLVSSATSDAHSSRKCLSAPPGGGGGTVEKTVDRRTARVGAVITYRIAVHVHARGFLSALYLRDRLPQGLAFVSRTGVASPGLKKFLASCTRGRTPTCRLSAVPPGVSLSFTVRAAPAPAARLRTRAKSAAAVEPARAAASAARPAPERPPA